jgi:hypothetical protein
MCVCLSTKVLNIHNSHTSATLKVGVHLGVIRLHPLHSPPFVKVCFIPKHILDVVTLTLDSWPKQGLVKVRAKSEAWESHFMPPGVGRCERMNPHTPKWAPTLGVGVSMDFQIFRGQLQWPKFIRLKTSLYHCKPLET